MAKPSEPPLAVGFCTTLNVAPARHGIVSGLVHWTSSAYLPETLHLENLQSAYAVRELPKSQL